MIFDSWQGILRVLILGSCAYLGLVLMLRISGKRTLSKMNSFDLVVTIALGSTLSSIILSKSVALMEGLTAFALLIILQFVVAWLSCRSRAFNRIVKNEPVLLVRSGQMLADAMRKERVTEEEVLQAIRNQSVASLADVEALVLETDGSMSVISSVGQKPVSWRDVKSGS
jgi:uncharacterized membrane protein YcaP (DUF421 family)